MDFVYGDEAEDWQITSINLHNGSLYISVNYNKRFFPGRYLYKNQYRFMEIVAGVANAGRYV